MELTAAQTLGFSSLTVDVTADFEKEFQFKVIKGELIDVVNDEGRTVDDYKCEVHLVRKSDGVHLMALNHPFIGRVVDNDIYDENDELIDCQRCYVNSETRALDFIANKLTTKQQASLNLECWHCLN